MPATISRRAPRPALPRPAISVPSLALRIAQRVSRHRDAPPTAAKIALWLIDRAHAQGALPVRTSLRQMQDAIGGHRQTLQASLEWMQKSGMVSVDETDAQKGRWSQLAIEVLP